MKKRSAIRTGVKWLGAGIGLAVGAYASSVGITWCWYGHPKRRVTGEAGESQLDQFIPDYEVVERHGVRVAAPVEIAFQSACEMNIQQSATVRTLFATRAWALGNEAEREVRQLGIVEQAREWGWGVLAEQPGREIVFGAVTQPWLANPSFRALRPNEFRGFHEPDYVKIAWNLRADPTGVTKSMVRTETRVVTTDPGSRAKFRRYWSFVWPGIVVIRRMGLRIVKTEAARRARGADARDDARR
jgi:hypothetical protein